MFRRGFWSSEYGEGETGMLYLKAGKREVNRMALTSSPTSVRS